MKVQRKGESWRKSAQLEGKTNGERSSHQREMSLKPIYDVE